VLTITTPPSSGQTLRIAMTASDTPTTTGIPNNGGEGFRFCGFAASDGLINWDFTHPEGIAGLTPGLASEWKIDDTDRTHWVFTLRDGVKFHDGTDVTVDAAIWNLRRFYDEKSPQFDAAASAIVPMRRPHRQHTVSMRSTTASASPIRRQCSAISAPPASRRTGLTVAITANRACRICLTRLRKAR
jgi:ABC-type transport system substrate-binding protein